jgi:molybdopterin-guanine dinucleotide biosynthesis protein B
MSGSRLDAAAPPPVVSFVGRSGTGKTTFLEQLLPALKKRGVTVGVLKHHAHPTPFDTPGKDTYRLAEAGAEVVVGASPVQTAVFIQEDGSRDLEGVIGRYLAGVDLVLTEGFQRADFTKIEMHRAARAAEEEEAGQLLSDPGALLAVVSDEPLTLADSLPQFAWDETDGVADLLITLVA